MDNTLNNLNVALGAERTFTTVVLTAKELVGQHSPAICQMCNALCQTQLQVEAGNPGLRVRLACDKNLGQGAMLDIEAVQTGTTDEIILTSELQVRTLRHAAARGVNCVTSAKNVTGI